MTTCTKATAMHLVLATVLSAGLFACGSDGDVRSVAPQQPLRSLSESSLDARRNPA